MPWKAKPRIETNASSSEKAEKEAPVGHLDPEAWGVVLGELLYDRDRDSDGGMARLPAVRSL
jgi:hypothetical protein